jgi:hypothetical protein
MRTPKAPASEFRASPHVAFILISAAAASAVLSR